jgi:hypothetical protein
VNFQVQDDHDQWFGFAILRPEIDPAFLYHEYVGLTRAFTPRRFVTLLVVVAALFVTASALATDPGLVDQYVEDIPTAGGTHHSGGSAGPTGSGGSTAGPANGPATLSPEVKSDLKTAGEDGRKLEEIATSPRYGAPPTSPAAQLSDEPGAPSTFGAAASAIGGDDGRIVGLFVALLAVTAAAVGIAAAGRRRRSA